MNLLNKALLMTAAANLIKQTKAFETAGSSNGQGGNNAMLEQLGWVLGAVTVVGLGAVASWRLSKNETVRHWSSSIWKAVTCQRSNEQEGDVTQLMSQV